MPSDISPALLTDDGTTTDYGLGRIAVAVRAPVLTGVAAPGAADEPHGEIYLPITDSCVVQLPDETVMVLPAGSMVRLAIGRSALERAGVLLNQAAGYLRMAYPPVL